jgi:hypothetical protein
MLNAILDGSESRISLLARYEADEEQEWGAQETARFGRVPSRRKILQATKATTRPRPHRISSDKSLPSGDARSLQSFSTIL